MTPHLRGHVRAYVDRALPAPLLRAFDQHLVCCGMCRALADQERRIVASLRSDTGVPHGLRTSLMGVAVEPAFRSSPPDVPRPPRGFRMPAPSFPTPVPTVAPTSPALHRSPVRAAVVASLAAGASVAAAWGLAVAPLPANSPLRTPIARVPAGAATVAPAGFAPAVVGPSWSRMTTTSPMASRSAVGATPTRTMQATTTPARISLVNSAESRP